MVLCYTRLFVKPEYHHVIYQQLGALQLWTPPEEKVSGGESRRLGACQQHPWAAAFARPCPHSASMGIFWDPSPSAFGLMGVTRPFAAGSCAQAMPKSGSAFAQSSLFSSLHENPVKGWREGADPRGHRHRLIGCATTCPLANALGSAPASVIRARSATIGGRAGKSVSRAATGLDQSASRIEIAFERVVRPSRRVLSSRFYA